MNTESIRRAAEVICAAEKKSTVPVTLAIALEAAGWLNTPETADELERLRTRVKELITAHDRLTGGLEQLTEAQERWVIRTTVAEAEAERLRDRVAELEAERGSLVADRDAQIIAWLGKKAREYGESNRESRAKSEAVRRMADKLSRGAVRQPLEAALDSLHPFEPEYQGESDAKRRLPQCKQCGNPASDPAHAEDVGPQVQRLRALLARQRTTVEDPHDGPLHHDYLLGHDLPEARNA